MDLTQLLRLARKNLQDNIPIESFETINNAIEELIISGIAQQSLKVGDTIPDFALPNHNGNLIKIQKLLKRGIVVISFYRGSWCPFCNLELQALEQALPAINMLGGTLVTISPQISIDLPESLEKQQFNLEMLVDKGNQVARQFNIVFKIPEKLRFCLKDLGIYIPRYNGDESFELPLPATYIVNQDGKIYYDFVQSDHTKRLDPVEIITIMRRMNNDSVLN